MSRPAGRHFTSLRQSPQGAAATGRPFSSRGFARALGAVGRLMITGGTVILLLVAYQLWGTNLQANRSQDKLQGQFERSLAETPSSTAPPAGVPVTSQPPLSLPGDDPGVVGSPGATRPPDLAPTIAAPAEGTPIGRLSIPSIGLNDFYFVEGTSVDQLKRGAAHYSQTPLPGQKGNAAIAGHRTTYGAPFHNIDKVRNGDMVTVETLYGMFRYQVMETQIVAPSEVSVLDNKGDNRLTLTACHPKFSAKQRIIISAQLVGNPAATSPTRPGGSRAGAAGGTAETASGRSAIDDFESEPVLRFPGAWWGLGSMLAWIGIRLLAWWGHRSRSFPRWIPYVLGTPACLVLLYFFFESFSYEAFARAASLSV